MANQDSLTVTRAHFIGIGGAGMSGIALVLHERGCTVTGSDLKSSRYVRELEEAGILEDISHMPARVKCAVLGWRTMDEIFKDADEGKIDKYSGKFD